MLKTIFIFRFWIPTLYATHHYYLKIHSTHTHTFRESPFFHLSFVSNPLASATTSTAAAATTTAAATAAATTAAASSTNSSSALMSKALSGFGSSTKKTNPIGAALASAIVAQDSAAQQNSSQQNSNRATAAIATGTIQVSYSQLDIC